jgi:Domain of unknown function (DUF4333)
MSGPQDQDPNQQWSSGEQQPAGSEQPPSDASWQPPAYTPPTSPQYSQPEAYPSTGPQYQQPTQYSQPGQYPSGQYGQQYPGQYAPTAQYGEAPATAESETGKGGRHSLAILGAIIGVLAALIVAVVLVMGFWKPGFFVTTKLDVNKAQSGVQQILTDQVNGYGVKNVKDVKCNEGKNPTVKKGETFTCDASVDGQHKQVTVTFQDDSGTYEVGRPK